MTYHIMSNDTGCMANHIYVPLVWNEQPIDKITSISASSLVSQKSLFVFGTGRLKKEIAKEYHPSGKLSCQKRKEITQQDHFVKREIFCKKMLI